MKNLSSFEELEELGEAIIKEYIKKTKQTNCLCVDIEGFVTSYLGLELEYENFAETDNGRIGFLSDGVRPLWVYRNHQRVQVLFPKGTVVLDSVLLRENESGRHRFSMAHEAAHKILERHIPKQTTPCFHSIFDAEANYTTEELHQAFSWNELLADRLGAVFLMPKFLVFKAIKKVAGKSFFKVYGNGIFAEEDKIAIHKTADIMGVSFTAFIMRLREFNLLERHDTSEYIGGNLHLEVCSDE